MNNGGENRWRQHADETGLRPHMRAVLGRCGHADGERNDERNDYCPGCDCDYCWSFERARANALLAVRDDGTGRFRDRPRLCKVYCSAKRAGGFSGPLCPHCDHCDHLVQLFERRLTRDGSHQDVGAAPQR